MAGSAWTNQLLNLLILSAGQTGFSGMFVYSPAPGAGNLTSSVAAVSGTDPYGNHYLPGEATYGSGFATVLQAGAVQFYTGSLAGGWALAASITTDAFGDLLILPAAGRTVTTTNNTLDDGSGNFTAAGTGTFNGTGISVGNGATANLTLVPKMATPPNLAAVVAGTATLAQTEACLGGIVQSMQNRQLVN
jgi:hypothetical protein